MDRNELLAEGYNNFGCQLQDCGYPTDAIAAFTRAIEVNPNYAEAYTNRGSGYYNKGRFTEAIADHVHAIQLKKDFAIAYSNLSVVLADQGKHEAALNCLHKAILSDPEFYVAHSNLISQMDLSSKHSVADLQAERKKWAHKFANVEQLKCLNDKTPNRKLKIGYVSADFKQHSAVYVFSRMLREYDRENFEVYCYSNSRYEDEVTVELKDCVDYWRTIAHLSDIDLCKCIQSDGIDILIDLSGHSAGNRLLTFAYKPAPVQITAWGYVGGTGLAQIDAFFADSIIVPEDEKHLYAEEVINLPCMVSGYNTEAFPDIGMLPADKNKYITFGSLNRFVKVSHETLQAWGEILSQVENSRLYLKCPEVMDEETQTSLIKFFEGYGVDKTRLIFKGRTSWFSHMEAYNDIDICLDPFPHGGGVTTLEGMMMGCPVVSFKWPSIVGRLSASILSVIGLTDWIVESTDDYVKLSVNKATELNGLRKLRKEIRGMLENSIIYSHEYVRTVESIYRHLWEKWCRNS